MPTKQTTWVMSLAVLGLVAVSTAQAQHLQPFGPYPTEHDLQFFAPFEDGDFGSFPEPNTGAYAQYERAFWSFSKPTVTQIGSPQAAGPFRVEGEIQNLENSLDTSFFNASAGWGNRFDIGYVRENRHGWQVGILHDVSQSQDFAATDVLVLFNDPNGLLDPFFIDRDGDGFADDLNDNNVFGPDGRDLGTPVDGDEMMMDTFELPFDGIPDESAPTDLNDLTTDLPRFGNFFATNSITMNSIELMKSYRFRPAYRGGIFELYAGARYMHVRDTFIMNLFLDETDAAPGETRGTFDDANVTTEVTNNIVGPQIGGRWTHQRSRWTLVAEGRFLAGFNAQDVNQTSFIASETPQPQASTTQVFGSGHRVSDYIEEFSAVGELRISTVLAITDSIDLTVGYTGHYLDNIARSSNRIDYTLPTFGLTRPDEEELWTHGVNFGVVLNRR